MPTVYFNIVDPEGTSVDVYPDQSVKLIKEPNQYDEESIEVWLMEKGNTGLDRKIGYVANSVSTVPLGTYSAGRLYDKIADGTFGIIIIANNEHTKLMIGEVELNGAN